MSSTKNDVACGEKRTLIHHLSEDISQLVLGTDKDDLSTAMGDQISKVVLPAQEMGCAGRHSILLAQVIGGAIVNK